MQFSSFLVILFREYKDVEWQKTIKRPLKLWLLPSMPWVKELGSHGDTIILFQCQGEDFNSRLKLVLYLRPKMLAGFLNCNPSYQHCVMRIFFFFDSKKYNVEIEPQILMDCIFISLNSKYFVISSCFFNQ